MSGWGVMGMSRIWSSGLPSATPIRSLSLRSTESGSPYRMGQDATEIRPSHSSHKIPVQLPTSLVPGLRVAGGREVLALAPGLTLCPNQRQRSSEVPGTNSDLGAERGARNQIKAGSGGRPRQLLCRVQAKAPSTDDTPGGSHLERHRLLPLQRSDREVNVS